jgi:phosphate uptake regulator
MWKEFVGLFKRETLSEEAFREAIVMLRDSRGMFDDAVASLRQEGPLDVDIYARDKRINKFERSVRRKILTHLAVSTNPDATMALVLTAIVMDIERIGDFTKNIVELASRTRHAFNAGEIDDEIKDIEGTVTHELEAIIPALEESDMDTARRIISDHNRIGVRTEEIIRSLISGKVLAGDSGTAVTVALYLRYLKRISAHVKNVATSVVNPYHRLGFKEKKKKKKAKAR